MKNKKKSSSGSIHFNKRLTKIRLEIDRIDKEIVERLNDRAYYVQEVGKLKEQHSEGVYRSEREQRIIKSLEDYLEKSKNKVKNNPAKAKAVESKSFPRESIKLVFKEIISACRSLENKLTIGYLGPEGSFTDLASQYQFGHLVESKPLKNFESIFEKVIRKEIDYGVIPLENSTDGMVNQSIDLFTRYDVSICAELFLTIHLNLYSMNKKLSDIKKIYSHPQPFAQSRNWLYQNLPNSNNIHTLSTSEAGQKILREKNSACIASKKIHEIYPQLHCLSKGIQDRSDNTTRFVVITKKPQLGHEVAKENITSLMIFIKDKPGALYEILAILAKAKVNLTNLVSRPSRKRAFDYLFYLDFIGDPQERRIQKVLVGIEKYVVTYKILGTYPRGMKYSS